MTLGNTLALCFTFGAFYSFLGSSQPILDEIYGRGDQFAAFFAVTAAAMGMVLFTGPRMMDHHGATRLGIGSLVATVVLSAGQLVICLATDGRPSVWVWFVFIVAMICSTSLVGPTCTSLAMEPMGHMAGTGIGGRGNDVDRRRRRAVGHHRLADRFDRNPDGGRLRRLLHDRPRAPLWAYRFPDALTRAS